MDKINSNQRTRIVWIDQLKAISIYIVIIGHSIITFKEGFLFKFIYSFHMPLFFIISGLVFQPAKYNTMWECTKDKFIKLLYPYVMLNILVLPFWYINVKTGMMAGDSAVTLIKGILYSNSEVYRAPSNATWFLTTLFIASIIYFALHFYLKNEKLVFIMSFGIALLGVIAPMGDFNQRPPFHLDAALVAQFFYGCGYVLRQNFQRFQAFFAKYAVIKVLLLLFIGTWFGKINKQVDFSNMLYRNFMYTLISSLILSLLIIYFVQKSKKYNRLISYIGQNTMIILAFHFPVLRVYQYLFPILKSSPEYCLVASVIVLVTMLPLTFVVDKLFGFTVRMPRPLKKLIDKI